MPEIKGSIPCLAVKAGGNMKQSRGNLVAIAFPILVLASVAGAGWYYYYTEADKNKILSMEISTQQGILNTDLENLQTRISKLLEDESALQARLQQEVKKVILTTAELEAELEKRRAEQKSLHSEIITVSGENSQLLDQLEQEQESKRHITNLTSRLERELDESRGEISQLKNQMTVIRLTSDVLFSPGSARIKLDGQRVLSIIAESLNAYPDRFISVEGHTDNLPIVFNTRYESNWELSTARGLAAVNYFQQNSQVDPRRLKVVGYGQYHPVSSNKSAEGRQRNRRIEIKILPPETAGAARN